MKRKIVSIIIKDLRMILSDKKALAIIIVMPLILMVILSFALKGTFSDTDGWVSEKINVAVVKQYDREMDLEKFDHLLRDGLLSDGMDEETLSELQDSGSDADPEEIFFREFLEGEELSEIIDYRIETENQARKLLNNGDVSAVVLLPEGYLYNMKVNLLTPFRNSVEIKVLTHPDQRISGQIVESIIKGFSDSMASIIIGKNVMIETAMADDLGTNSSEKIRDVMEGVRASLEGIQVDIKDVSVEGKKQINSADYYAMAMLTMFILFAASHGGRMLLEEKENITFQRMMMAGTSRTGILIGKFITVFLIAMIQIIVMIGFSSIALNVVWGNTLSVALISIASALAIAGVGVAIGAATFRVGNYKMANIFETAVIQTMALLGGSFLPIDVMPDFMQKLSFLSLNGIALKAYQKIMMGYQLNTIMSYLLILIATGFLFSVLAVYLFKGKEGTKNAQYHKVKVVKA